MNTKTLMVVALLALLGAPAWAQQQPAEECIDGALDCKQFGDDPICVVQKKFNLQQSGRCDRATAGALIGDGFARYYTGKGTFVTEAEQLAFAICSKTAPARNDGKCGWYRFEEGDAAGGGGGDPADALAARFKADDKAVADFAAKLRKAEDARRARHVTVKNKLGVWTGNLDWFVITLGGGGTNSGGHVGGSAALHVPVGRYRSGMEIGVQGGYGGAMLDPGSVTLVGVAGPFAQGVIMPWPIFGFVLGAGWEARLPSDKTAPTHTVTVRLGGRVYATDWLGFEAMGLPGFSITDGKLRGVGGGLGGVVLHF